MLCCVWQIHLGVVGSQARKNWSTMCLHFELCLLENGQYINDCFGFAIQKSLFSPACTFCGRLEKYFLTKKKEKVGAARSLCIVSICYISTHSHTCEEFSAGLT